MTTRTEKRVHLNAWDDWRKGAAEIRVFGAPGWLGVVAVAPRWRKPELHGYLTTWDGDVRPIPL
jgi:hypothetical protein